MLISNIDIAMSGSRSAGCPVYDLNGDFKDAGGNLRIWGLKVLFAADLILQKSKNN